MKSIALIRVAVAGMLMMSLGGCAIFGLVAHAVPKYIPARYAGLKEKSTAVMVWTTPGLRIDWGLKLQMDLASSIQNKLEAQARVSKDKGELKGTTFPINPLSVVRYQRDHPEIDGIPVTQVAPRFDVQRLVYVELTQFSTQSSYAVALYRGTATVNIRVVEVGGGQATIGYAEDNIEVAFPPKSPPEGTPNGSVETIYTGTVNQLATAVTQRFYTYPSEN